jgi:pimeloyl-ACP methyl ester carboxylesterase
MNRHDDTRKIQASMRRLFELGGVDPVSRFDTVDGIRLHGVTLGAGPRLLLIHGASGGCANWFRIIRALSERFSVCALDLPGFGLSDPAPGAAPVGVWSADLVDRWLDAVGWDGGHMVGTSFGGHVALRLALSRPDRFRSVAVINATGLGREVAVAVRLAALPLIGPALLAPSRRGTRALFRTLLTTDRTTIEGAAESALLEYLYLTARAGQPSLAQSFRDVIGVAGQREILGDDDLRAIAQPTLLLWGGVDPFLPPAHGRRAARIIPRALSVELPGVGHSPNWERPDLVVDALLPFLRSARPVA